eukprot:scaffold2134_cov384-Prasinococcus_capsulatus_cf.AAC.10
MTVVPAGATAAIVATLADVIYRAWFVNLRCRCSRRRIHATPHEIHLSRPSWCGALPRGEAAPTASAVLPDAASRRSGGS